MSKIIEQKLNFLKSLSTEQKVNVSKEVLRNAYLKYDGVYVSTGGADSLVIVELLKEIDQSLYDIIPRVCNGVAENPLNVKYNKRRGDIILSSELNIKQVIQKYGYPLISKSVAMKISRYKNSKHDWAKERRLKGYMGDNDKWCYASMIPKKYQFLIYAPFEFTEKCCDIVKKKPLKQYEKISKRIPITGERVDESNDRLKAYLKNGCFHNGKREKVTPIAFWSDKDKLEFLYSRGIKLPKPYNKIVKNGDGLQFDGEQRTGCECCGFGILYDKNRFERIKEKNINKYNAFMFGGAWVRKSTYRWVKFRPNGILIYSNLYWQPNEKGYGYKFCLDYIYKGLAINNKK